MDTPPISPQVPRSGAAPITPRQDLLPGFADQLAAFRGRLEREIAAFLARKRQAAGAAALGELVDALEQLMAHGGKRLRPALVYHTYLACARPSGPAAGAGPTEAAEPAAGRTVWSLALATEFLHSYLLIHDDIMDHAAVRRGQPSAHVRFRDAHRARSLAGDAEDFGRSVAILLGDLAHSYAVELFTALDRPAAPATLEIPETPENTATAGELASCFSAMCEEVIGGQYLELALAHRGARRSAEELTAVLRLKSGRYTAERPIQLGALFAGAPPRTLRLLSEYGCAVGEAFQLQDDLLGTFGDAGAVGKPVGADLREGKFTFLIYHALERASAGERAEIETALGAAGASDREVERVRSLLASTGARAAVEAMIEERLERARAALGALAGGELRPAGRLFLAGLLDYLREREQ